MKKLALALTIVALAAGVLSAADKKPVPAKGNAAKALTPIYDKGTMTAELGLGYLYSSYSGFLANAGADLMFVRFDVPDVMPITIGAAARAVAISYWNYFYVDAGVLAVAHFGFKQIAKLTGQPEFAKFDFYVGLGLGIGLVKPSWDSTPFMSAASIQGVSYFFNPKMALTVEESRLNNFWETSANLTFKL